MKHALCILAALLAAWPAAAQTPGDAAPIRLWPQIGRYLELTPQQVLELVQIQAEWGRFLAAKSRRVAQVESELRDETLAEVLDPLALGLRYLELEAICRESRDMDRKLHERARTLMTEPQRAKLAVLEQAYRLLPVIVEADGAKLVDAPLPGLNVTALGLPAETYPGCRYRAPAPQPQPQPQPQPHPMTPAAEPAN